MTRIRFDQLAKQYLEEFLEPLGTVQRTVEVPGEPKFVDLWFVPSPAAPGTDLGLLGQIVTTACLLEPFRNAPKRPEIRSCLLKLLWIQEDQRRKAAPPHRSPIEAALPRLWILAATVTQPVITDFGCHQRPNWPSGVYFAPEGYKAVIVAIDQLPVTPDTLWLRILGRDATQQAAIAEVVALPPDQPQRARILQLLVNWRITLELSQELEPEEQGLMGTLSQAYLAWERETERRGEAQGEVRGKEQEARSLILRLLNRKVGELPESLRSQVMALPVTQLETLGEALLDFQAIADLSIWLQANPSQDNLSQANPSQDNLSQDNLSQENASQENP